jgi:hypothetical protein
MDVGNHVIDGYTDKLSYFPGDSAIVYLNATDTLKAYKIKLYDLRGKEVAQYSTTVFPQKMDQTKPYEFGFGYSPTMKISVPDLKSGVYLWDNKIPFIVKSHAPKIIVLYSSNTENAYCNAGGKSLYTTNSTANKAATKVSFLRPIQLPKHSEAFLRWIVTQDIDNVGYITDVDLEQYNSIKKCSLLIIAGHSEYWTLQARKNFDRFVADGKNALVLSGNTMWWQVRYNKTKDQLICYRKASDDPMKSKKLKTINWNDLTLAYSITQSLGVDFSLAGYGKKADKGWDGYRIVCRSPLLEGTKLHNGDILYFQSDEHDGAPLVNTHDAVPLINKNALGFDKAEIIGFDRVSRGGVDGVATWIIFKATKTSGTVINTASTNWCAYNGIGINSDIQKITLNMITKLINNENVFSTDENKEVAAAIN